MEAAGAGNYQTLINSALRNCIRELSSEIAEDREGYGEKLAVAKAKKSAVRHSKEEQGTPITLEHKLHLRSDDLARSLGVSRGELIERGLKAILAAQGRL